MKKLLLLLCVFIFAFVAKASTLSVSVDGNTATITVDGDEYYDLNNASLLGSLESSVRNCENLVFVGKFSSVQGLQGFSNVKSVDYKDAQFQDYSNMKFSLWNNTIETAITSKYCTGYVERDVFQNCKELVTVEFNGGMIKGIANNASDVPKLQNLRFNDGVTRIENQAFWKLLKNEGTTIILPSTLTYVGEQAFEECTGIDQVTMNGLNQACSFGKEAFASCSSLRHITLSEGVTGISEKMFDKCGMLESVRIPTTCKKIGDEAFNICVSLHTLVLPEGVEELGKKVFNNGGIKDIYVMATSPDKVPKIYPAGVDGFGNEGGTLLHQYVTASGADPSTTHSGDIGEADEETILRWYQEEKSGPLGEGGGDCLIQLHYPESMRWFYDGLENPNATTEKEKLAWLETAASDRLSQELLDKKLRIINDSTYKYISYGYAGGNSQYPAFGPDPNGKYWPTATDYILRIKAGAVDGNDVLSSLGWRQLPLQKSATVDDYIFSKEYDDTWYTMCFPWDMDDNTLFRAFNQKCEITEFVGVEVKNTDDPSTEDVEYSLVFHFDKVASTYYVTENHTTDHLRYERVSSYTVNGEEMVRTEQVSTPGGSINKKFYVYHRVEGSDGPEYVYWPKGLGQNSSQWPADKKEMANRYNSILHMMVYAGHPYMIHPGNGASPGTPASCDFTGVKKLVGIDYNQLALDNAVTKIATTDGEAYLSSGGHAGVTHFVNPENGGGGSYTFIGNVGENAKDMLAQSNPAYFLAVTNPTGEGGKADKTDLDQIYPKFYRKTSGGVGKWSQYSAIICPDANALANIEGLDGMQVTQTSGSGAKGFDVVFGEWEVVTPTAIDEIIADAERADQPVKKVNMNVVFNINGEVVREGTPSVEGLPKGLYIVNGKKYMVK